MHKNEGYFVGGMDIFWLIFIVVLAVAVVVFFNNL